MLREFLALYPLGFIGALALLLLFLPIGVNERKVSLWVALAVVLALIMQIEDQLFLSSSRLFLGSLASGWSISYIGVVLILFFSLTSIVIMSGSLNKSGVYELGEFYSLLLFVVVGAAVFLISNDLFSLFVGLEMMSIPLYCMAGAAIKDKRSVEAGLKYFLLGAFASAIMLYGISLVYGLVGSTNIETIASVGAYKLDNPVGYLSIGMLLVGFMFKLGIIPFHFWVPDAYQGAPTGVTAFMAVVVKIAATIAAIRVVNIGLSSLYDVWSPIVWVLSLVTMVGANLIALRQRSVKRMLAYSSIAHAGYILSAFLALSGKEHSTQAMSVILFYLLAYSVLTLGAFGCVIVVQYFVNKEDTDRAVGGDLYEDFSGLSSLSPFVALLMSLFVLGLSGLPPGFIGLVGKFMLFSQVVKAGYVGLAVLGVLSSAVSCYYYLKVIVYMYFRDSKVALTGNTQGVLLSLPVEANAALLILGLIAVFLGLFPGYIMEVFSSISY